MAVLTEAELGVRRSQGKREPSLGLGGAAELDGIDDIAFGKHVSNTDYVVARLDPGTLFESRHSVLYGLFWIVREIHEEGLDAPQDK